MPCPGIRAALPWFQGTEVHRRYTSCPLFPASTPLVTLPSPRSAAALASGHRHGAPATDGASTALPWCRHCHQPHARGGRTGSRKVGQETPAAYSYVSNSKSSNYGDESALRDIRSTCTKLLRDSFGLTTFVRLEGMLLCAALGRTRHTVRLPPLTWSLDGRTLLLSEERTNTIPILHKP